METLEKDWFSIEEAAEYLGCKVDDVTHFIQAGKIKPVFWFDNEPAILDRGNGEKHQIAINGLWDCLSSLRYSLQGCQPVVYPIENPKNRRGSLEREFKIVDSFDKAIEKKEIYPHIIRHIVPGEPERILVATDVVRFDGGSATAKKVILNDDLQNFKLKAGSSVNATMEAAMKPSAASQEQLPFEHGTRFLEGWKEIASYLGVHESTAKRHYGTAVRLKEHSRKVITTTTALDKCRLESATKKIRKKAK